MRAYAWKATRWNSDDPEEGVVRADSVEEALRHLRRLSYIVHPSNVSACPEETDNAQEALRKHLLSQPEKLRPDWFRSANTPRPRPRSKLSQAHERAGQFIRRSYHRFSSWLSQKDWSSQQRSQFYFQLGTMFDAGVPLHRAIDLQRQQMSNPWAQQCLETLLQKSDFSEAFRNSGLFPEFELAQLEASLENGTLGSTLVRLSRQVEKVESYKRNFFSQLQRPLLTLGFLYTLAPFLGYLVGTLLSALGDLQGNGLPSQLARLLTNLPLLAALWTLPLLLMLFAYRKLQQSLSSEKRHRLLGLPRLGGMLWSYDMGISLGLFANLIESGVSLSRSLELCQKISLSDCWSRMSQAVERGQPLSTGLLEGHRQERALQKTLRASEESGQVPALCQRFQSYLEEDLDHQLRGFFSLFEPLLAVLVAALALALSLTVLLPIQQVIQSI